MLRSIIISLLSLLFLSTAVESYAIRAEIGERLAAARSDEEVIEVLREYLDKTEDMAIIRDIQDTWMETDPVSGRDYFVQKYEADPTKVNHYLWARYIEDTFERLQEARKLIELYPDYYYGYLLLSFPYNQYLFPEEPADDAEIDIDRLKQKFIRDRQHLYKWLYLYPDDEFTLYTFYNISMWENNYELAEKFLLQTEDIDTQWVNYWTIMDFSVKTKKLQPFKTFLPNFMQSNIEAGRIAREDSLTTYANYYLLVLRSIGDYDSIEKYLDSNPELYQETTIQRRLVSAYIDQGEYEEAFYYLNKLLEAGNINYLNVHKEKQWLPLTEQPQWEEFMSKAAEKWEETKPARKQETLAQRVNRAAPKWDLKDINDNIIRLADFDGKPVIQLFWATWSDESLEMMTGLDEWVKKNEPEEIAILAISMVEPYPELVQRHINREGYSDKIKFISGVDYLPSLYGFQELPYLTVIDQDANIRYEQRGTALNIKEKLDWWTEEILSR